MVIKPCTVNNEGCLPYQLVSRISEPSTVSPTTCYREGVHNYPTLKRTRQIIFHKWQTVGLIQLDDEPNLFMKNGCFTKHPLKTGCLGFQVVVFFFGEFFYSDALMRKQYYWYEPRIQDLQSSNASAFFCAYWLRTI